MLNRAGRSTTLEIVAEDRLIAADDIDGVLYRIAALPRDGVEADDVILSDPTGQCYLLSEDGAEPTPLEVAETDALGMFFEPSVDLRWHTLTEVRLMIFGGEQGLLS
jgi:hypothetical protein